MTDDTTMSDNPNQSKAENREIKLRDESPFKQTSTSPSSQPTKFKGKTQIQSDSLKADALSLKALGYSDREAAAKLGLKRSRIRYIYESINEEWRDRLINSLLKEQVPLEYAASLTLYQILIRKTFEILDSTSDARVKTECIRCISGINQEIGKLWGDSQGLAANLKNTLVIKSSEDKGEREGKDLV